MLNRGASWLVAMLVSSIAPAASAQQPSSDSEIAEWEREASVPDPPSAVPVRRNRDLERAGISLFSVGVSVGISWGSALALALGTAEIDRRADGGRETSAAEIAEDLGSQVAFCGGISFSVLGGAMAIAGIVLWTLGSDQDERATRGVTMNGDGLRVTF